MKVQIPFYPLKEYMETHKNWITDSINDVIDSGYAIGGPEVEKFESAFANFTNSKHCIGVANGLDAIRLALQALNIGPGDEVIVPAFTFMATWLAVIQVGAKPIPVDVSDSTAALDLANLPISEKTKAVIFVHLFGIPTDLTALASHLKANNIYLIEDCAQAQGARTRGKHVGTFGDAGCFSFYPTKNLGAFGDAGAVITNDDSLAEKIKSLRSYGVGKTKYDHVNIGVNSRLDPIQAGFLRRRLDSLDLENLMRRELASRISDSLLSSGIMAPLSRETEGNDVFHLFVAISKVKRSQIQEQLLDLGIQTDIHYPIAIHKQKCFNTPEFHYLANLKFPVSEYLSEKVLSLPNYPWMSRESSQYLVNSIASME